jgi:hypothetical protein
LVGHDATNVRGSSMRAKLLALGAAVVVCTGSVAACADMAGKDRGEGQAVSRQTIEQALRAHNDTLMSLPGVVGTAQSLCAGQPCIKVFVIERTEKLEEAVRRILAGYPVVIEERGPIRARPEQQAPQ